MKRLSVLLFAAALSALSFSCGPEDHSPPVAKVGDAVLSQARLAESLPIGADEFEGAERTAFIDNWVRQELLYQEALDQGLDDDPGIRELLEQTRRDLLVATLLDRHFEGRETRFDEAEVEAYYQERREEFLRDRPEIRVRHVLLSSQREANAARQALDRGEPFADVVNEYSQDFESKTGGGDLGYFSAEADPALWEACRDLEVDEISKPVQTGFGYHIIQVLDRQEAGTYMNLEQVRPQIVEVLVRQRYRQQLDELVGRLKGTREWSLSASPATDPSSVEAPSQ